MENIQQINELAASIHADNKAKGFWDSPRNVGEMLMLVTSELGEAMEAHRKGRFANLGGLGDGDFKTAFEMGVKDTFEDELADAIIRLLDMSAGMGVDIAEHIRLKLQYNRGRDRLHGKRY